MKNNIEERRFELEIEGHQTFASYSRDSKKIFINHVEAAPELRGKGAAAKLMKEIVDFAKKNDLEIIPICSYAVAWIKKNKLIENI